jgi:hypothetical protein
VLDGKGGGKGTAVATAVMPVALTAVANSTGGVPATLPACDAAATFACPQGRLATAGGALTPVNVRYVTVDGRVFGSATRPTTAGMVAKTGT